MMHFNALDLIQSFAVALPTVAMLLVAIAVAVVRLKQIVWTCVRPQKLRRIAMSAAIGLAFLPFASIYRPNLIEVAKAQIQQQESVDEDDSGDPENSPTHLNRQLRRIRRGEEVGTLYLRR